MATSVNQGPYYASSFASVGGVEDKDFSNEIIPIFPSFHIKQRCYGGQARSIPDYTFSA